MSVSDISLTSGMRSNLLSLQSTVSLIDRTQERLSTGKKVNTAIDNPVSYFASEALTSRANSIDSLKDAMGQAVQTVTAADKGITAITTLIEQAKGIAQSAQTADNTQDTVTLTLASVTDGASNTVAMDGVTFTATTGGAETSFDVGSNDAATAANLAAAINNYDWSGKTDTWSATVSGSAVKITKVINTTEMNVNAAVADITLVGGTITAAKNTAPTSELESLQTQYNTMRAQLTALAQDSGYKGKNLLNGDNLAVQFEGASLNVAGFDATATGLGITNVTDWTTDKDNITGDIDLLDAATTTLRTKSSEMSNNLSTITVRQDFSTNMINTLTEGSDKLTLADTNEEGANMLMLQTRQSLSTTALSLSAQAAQSVLKLFG